MMAAKPVAAALSRWLDPHTAAAPAALRERVYEYVASVGPCAELPAGLAAAGNAALASVLAHPGDRSVALDLLAADALVTLALLAQAETAPEHLETFADQLLRVHLPPR
jgi:hypothetical protein